MAKRKQRIRSPHPGVYLKRRKLKGRVSWRARYFDPDKRKEVYETLDAASYASVEARVDWAKKKSKELARRRDEIGEGIPRRTRTPVGTAVDDFLKTWEERPTGSKKTVATYRQGVNRFRTWAEQNSVPVTENLTTADLEAFREYLSTRGRRVAVSNKKRGAKEDSAKPQSPFSINRDLRSVKVMLNHWRRKRKLPYLSRDDIADSLKAVDTPRNPPDFLSAAKCKTLLEAALRHDGEMFEVTRDEHAGLRTPGSTPKYEPIAPFVSFVLLTGCRVGEAENLLWDRVELDATDQSGNKIGEIRLRAEDTKTKRARRIGLEVCPSVRSLLTALKLRAGSDPFVFGGPEPRSHDQVEAARKRLTDEHGAPSFSWQNLRQTAGTFLTNAPGIYGAASAFMSARQLGHSVAVAERHYLDVHRGIPKEARNLEEAFQIKDVMEQIVERAQTAPNRPRRRIAKKKEQSVGR